MLITMLSLCISGCVAGQERPALSIFVDTGGNWERTGQVRIRFWNAATEPVCIGQIPASPTLLSVSRDGRRVRPQPLPRISQPGECLSLGAKAEQTFVVDASPVWPIRRSGDVVCYGIEYVRDGRLESSRACEPPGSRAP